MLPILGLAATLTAFWLLLSGHYTPPLLGLGAVAVALVLWLATRMDIVDHETRHLHFGRRVPLYWLWLGAEVLRSSWDISRRILAPYPRLNPVLHRLDVQGLSEVAQATYANSLTLTPGTLAVQIDDNGLLTHALHPELLDGVAEDTMGARVRALELH